MYILLNPAKARNFTTKGINLNFNNPAAFVPEDLEEIFKDKIYQAIRDEIIFEVDGIEDTGINIKGQASTTAINDESEKTVGKSYLSIGEDGKPVRVLEFFKEE
jgi:hypothetical protein